MRALSVTSTHRLALTDHPDPQPSPGSVLVRVAACGICGSDLHLMESKLVPPGAILGHEAAGIVEAVGDGVDGIATGDRVAIQPFDPCGGCDPCRAGASQRCVDNALTTIGLGSRPGAFAELVELSPQMVVPVSTEVPIELLAVAEPLAVAVHGFARTRFEPGMTVGVVGCGPVGLCAVLAAQALGAGRVWACDPNGFRADLAAQLGAEATGASPEQADIVFECAGVRGTIEAAVNAAVPGGQVAVLAVHIGIDEFFPALWVTREVDVLGCLGYTVDEYAQTVGWIADGTVDVAPMVTKRVGFDEADEVFFSLLAGAAEGKVLVTP